VVFELGAAGRIWSLAFANVAIAIFILPKMRLKYNLTWKIDKILLKKALAFSLPLLPHDLSSWIIRLADRIILTSLASVAMTGTYSVGVALCSPISLVADGFGRAWVPFVYNALNYGTNQSKQEIVAVGKLITLAVAFGGLTIALFSTEIVRLALPTSYHESAAVVPVISLALVASTMYRILIVPVYYVKKTALVFWATMFGALTNLVCNFLLIPHFGGVGAAWSWCIALFIQILISLFVSQKILFLPWGLRFFTPIFLATLISQYAHFFEINSVRGRILCDALFLLCILSPLHLSRTEQAYLRYCCFSNIERSNSYFTL
jgi:O-antigen/teichoic acid export membrane protein